MPAKKPTRLRYHAPPATPLDPVARRELLLRRLMAVQDAKDNLLSFARLMRPTPEDPDDPSKSLYTPAKHHKVIAHALHDLEAGRLSRLIINVPPRHGKTELASKLFIPWVIGRNPTWSVIFGTYNEKFSWDIGRSVRATLLSSAYAQVFPHVKITKEAVDTIETNTNAMVAFTGRGGTITGRGGDLLVIDDPIKDQKEADSPTTREDLWQWFTNVIGSRMMTETARVMLVQTRWHSDDLVGRLTDPANDHYDREEARRWRVLDLPALAEANDPLGRAEGEPLWPERFGREFLEERRRQNPRGFAALYQGRPRARGGNMFQEGWLRTYNANELPPDNELRFYCTSDHAVATAQISDRTCLIPFGVDRQGDIWVLPDVWWRKADAATVVEAMLTMIRRRRPLIWWAERSHISRSIGPFLRKRMLEEQVFAPIHEIHPVADKQTRAQSIQGRMAMGRVRFPVFATWWPMARDELLSFPAGQHDDFVDALAYIGLGLDTQVPARRTESTPVRNHEGITLGALKAATRRAERELAAQRNGGF